MNLYLANNSNFPADQLPAIVAALNEQLSGPFESNWRISATISSDPAPPNSVTISIDQTSDVSGALGYHDVDPTTGIPFARVFVDDSAAAAVPISSVLSHEIIELLADAFVDEVAVLDNEDGSGTLYAFELCDPVEADSLPASNGVILSNFVLPAWFDQTNLTGPFDAAGNLDTPFSATSGGYMSVRDIDFTDDWQQIFASGTQERSRATVARK